MSALLQPSQLLSFLLFDLVMADSFGALRDAEHHGLGAVYALRLSGLISEAEHLEAAAQLKEQAKQRRTQLRAGQ